MHRFISNRADWAQAEGNAKFRSHAEAHRDIVHGGILGIKFLPAAFEVAILERCAKIEEEGQRVDGGIRGGVFHIQLLEIGRASCRERV